MEPSIRLTVYYQPFRYAKSASKHFSTQSDNSDTSDGQPAAMSGQFDYGQESMGSPVEYFNKRFQSLHPHEEPEDSSPLAKAASHGVSSSSSNYDGDDGSGDYYSYDDSSNADSSNVFKQPVGRRQKRSAVTRSKVYKESSYKTTVTETTDRPPAGDLSQFMRDTDRLMAGSSDYVDRLPAPGSQGNEFEPFGSPSLIQNHDSQRQPAPGQTGGQNSKAPAGQAPSYDEDSDDDDYEQDGPSEGPPGDEQMFQPPGGMGQQRQTPGPPDFEDQSSKKQKEGSEPPRYEYKYDIPKDSFQSEVVEGQFGSFVNLPNNFESLIKSDSSFLDNMAGKNGGGGESGGSNSGGGNDAGPPSGPETMQGFSPRPESTNSNSKPNYYINSKSPLAKDSSNDYDYNSGDSGYDDDSSSGPRSSGQHGSSGNPGSSGNTGSSAFGGGHNGPSDMGFGPSSGGGQSGQSDMGFGPSSGGGQSGQSDMGFGPSSGGGQNGPSDMGFGQQSGGHSGDSSGYGQRNMGSNMGGNMGSNMGGHDMGGWNPSSVSGNRQPAKKHAAKTQQQPQYYQPAHQGWNSNNMRPMANYRPQPTAYDAAYSSFPTMPVHRAQSRGMRSLTDMAYSMMDKVKATTPPPPPPPSKQFSANLNIQKTGSGSDPDPMSFFKRNGQFSLNFAAGDTTPAPPPPKDAKKDAAPPPPPPEDMSMDDIYDEMTGGKKDKTTPPPPPPPGKSIQFGINFSKIGAAAAAAAAAASSNVVNIYQPRRK
ncbi:hypothetical protein HDE_11654 [Halotydeus destructor]|nr:hypothetical protein HDE_11654 [Halotydeus destructor]